MRVEGQIKSLCFDRPTYMWKHRTRSGEKKVNFEVSRREPKNIDKPQDIMGSRSSTNKV